MPRLTIAVALSALGFVLVLALPARPEPTERDTVRVIDGDTIRLDREVNWVVGFDAAETRPSLCIAELQPACRLRELVAGGNLDLERVPCSCRSGNEDTPGCNRGARFGELKAQGRDVGGILVSEGLARPFRCGVRSCPNRPGWC
jgi:micrococcal nuclease